jgi:nucleoside-diphosphate-sugar epimerase
MKTAFVTGATGFLGTNLVDELVGQGWQVMALRRRASGVGDLQRFPVRLAEGDILDLASLRASIPEGVDAVFHLAASTSLWSRRNAEQTRINVDGTRNVVEAALARGARRRRAAATARLTSVTHHRPRLRERVRDGDLPAQQLAHVAAEVEGPVEVEHEQTRLGRNGALAQVAEGERRARDPERVDAASALPELVRTRGFLTRPFARCDGCEAAALRSRAR